MGIFKPSPSGQGAPTERTSGITITHFEIHNDVRYSSIQYRPAQICPYRKCVQCTGELKLKIPRSLPIIKYLRVLIFFNVANRTSDLRYSRCHCYFLYWRATSGNSKRPIYHEPTLPCLARNNRRSVHHCTPNPWNNQLCLPVYCIVIKSSARTRWNPATPNQRWMLHLLAP